MIRPGAIYASIVVGGLDGLSLEDNSEQHRVLVALSGGGARGIASIGVLQAFHEKGIKVEAIAGTSIGGIIGGLYACGYSPDDLARMVRDLDLNGLFSNKPARQTMFQTQREERGRHLVSIRFDGFKPVVPRALTAGQKLTSILTAWTTRANYHAAGNFNNLPIPFKTIATDIVTGEEVILESGSLPDAMRATMGFPLAFTPLDKDERLLMDGGMVTPVPVELVRTMSDSIDFVVAINTASPLVKKEDLSNPVEIANQVTSIMTADKLEKQLKQADYVIKPPLNGTSMSDFEEKEALVEIGYQTGLKAADSILSLLQQKTDTVRYKISRVEIDSCSGHLLSYFTESLGDKSVTMAELVKKLKKLATRLDLFRIETRLERSDDSTAVGAELNLFITTTPVRTWDNVTINITGNRTFEDSLLIPLIQGESEAVTPSSLRAGLDRLQDYYRRFGYDLVDIEQAELSDCGSLLTVVVDEAIVAGIDIDGNRRTRDWLIKSNFTLREGRPFSTRRASQGMANIFASDLFNRVTIDLVPGNDGARLHIGVEERFAHQMRFGWHWDDRYQ